MLDPQGEKLATAIRCDDDNLHGRPLPPDGVVVENLVYYKDGEMPTTLDGTGKKRSYDFSVPGEIRLRSYLLAVNADGDEGLERGVLAKFRNKSHLGNKVLWYESRTADVDVQTLTMSDENDAEVEVVLISAPSSQKVKPLKKRQQKQPKIDLFFTSNSSRICMPAVAVDADAADAEKKKSEKDGKKKKEKGEEGED